MYAGYTLEMLGWPKALLIAACGIVITFIMLGILDLIIMIISKIVSSIEGKKPAVHPEYVGAHVPLPPPPRRPPPLPPPLPLLSRTRASWCP